MREKPFLAPMAFDEARPGDVIVVKTIERKRTTSFITVTLGVVTQLHPDVPALIYRPQWKRVFPDGAWGLGRDIPYGEDEQAFLPENQQHQYLYRVLPAPSGPSAP